MKVEKCVLCNGSGRLRIRKESGNKKEKYIHAEERCQMCNGKGEISYER